MRKLKKQYKWGAYLLGILLLIAIYKIISPDHFKLNRRKFPIIGIDVSKHNDRIKWDQVKLQDISFVFIKATEGKTSADPTFKYNYEEARKAGIKVGAYHFFKYNRDGVEQANSFLKQVRQLKLDLPPALDIEDHYNFTNRNKPSLVVKEIKKFVKTVEARTGRKVLIYTNQNEYKKYIKDNFNQNPIWISSLEEEPEIDRVWRFWQYTHRGKLEGVKGFVDYNTFNGSKDEWADYLRTY